MSHKLWGGRFNCETNTQLEYLNASINIDKRMYAEDITGSKEYAKSLKSINLLTQQETQQICDGLDKVKLEWEDGTFVIKCDEDIHSANERRLKELIGEPATKLHVGRSRNDQVATDMKLWLRKSIGSLDAKLHELIEVILTRARTEIDYLLPGYTHLQRAQPVRWSHFLLSYAGAGDDGKSVTNFESEEIPHIVQAQTEIALHQMKNRRVLGQYQTTHEIVRLGGGTFEAVGVLLNLPVRGHAWYFKNDSDKVNDILKRFNLMPLGSGAIAGNPFNIDRKYLAKKLNFDGVTPNSMQAVGDRDFIAEFLFWASLTGTHLTRMAEDLIIYSSKEFNFIDIHDSFSTGSSLMPQKRNPDSLELIRGIGAGLFGQCCSFMMVLKSLPSTYNKDLQSDKESMFSTYDKLMSILEVIIGTIQSLKVNSMNCYNALSFDMLATDLAYYLVRKNVPFREAHHIAGNVVSAAETRGVEMYDLTLEELRSISEHFEADAAKIWNYENSVEQYEAIGGTARSSVLYQIQTLDSWLVKDNNIL